MLPRPPGGDEVGGYFVDVILGDGDELDFDRARDEHVAAARLLLDRHPDVGAIVLECANMPPYASDVARALRRPVYDWYSMVSSLARGLRPRAFFSTAGSDTDFAVLPPRSAQ